MIHCYIQCSAVQYSTVQHNIELVSQIPTSSGLAVAGLFSSIHRSHRQTSIGYSSRWPPCGTKARSKSDRLAANLSPHSSDPSLMRLERSRPRIPVSATLNWPVPEFTPNRNSVWLRVRGERDHQSCTFRHITSRITVGWWWWWCWMMSCRCRCPTAGGEAIQYSTLVMNRACIQNKAKKDNPQLSSLISSPIQLIDQSRDVSSPEPDLSGDW